jgi:lactoylglutathione lyase
VPLSVERRPSRCRASARSPCSSRTRSARRRSTSVFGLPAAYEYEDAAGFKLENTIVNLLTIPAARELIDPAPVAERASGSRFQLTIWVNDADAACAALAERGVELVYGPTDRGWGMRTAAFLDPDGHICEVAQELAQ